jgi:ActR/RegA family two-component response regulator
MSSPAAGVSAGRALLISNDSETVRQLMEGMQQLAITTESCSDISAAIALLNRQKFEAVIVDLAIGEQASQLFERIRISPSNHHAVTFAIADSQGALAAVQERPGFVMQRPLTADAIERTFKAAFGLIIREHRRYFRYPLTVPAVVEESPGKELQCQLVNLSEGGVAVSSVSSLVPGAEVKLQFALPGLHDFLKLGAEICWYDQKGRAGLRFLGPSPDQQSVLQDWLAARLEERLPESVARKFQRAE